MLRTGVSKPLFQSKEDTNFTEALKLYDAKQYKKALKLIDTNLKKKSGHSQSLALKGLLLYHIENSNFTECFDPENDFATYKSYFERALKDGKDHPVINHMIGIFYGHIQDYENAMKHYRVALDNGSKNVSLWRDISSCESQMRKYKPLITARTNVFNSFTGYRASWTALAIAHYLNKNYELALKTLSGFEDLAKGKLSENESYENSELILFKNKVIFESGDIQGALDHLIANYDDICDKTSVLCYKAQYYLLLKDYKKASLTYRQLLQRNPDNLDYYLMLERSLKISCKNTQKRLRLYQKLEKFYPKSDGPKVIPLTFLKADDPKFVETLEAYLFSKLRKGVPSIFKNLEFIYTDLAKIDTLSTCIFKFLNDESNFKKTPDSFVWCLYYISQHYLKLHQLDKSMEFIDKAIEHTPTLVELYLFKANILKHKQEYSKAADLMNEARMLDLQDRFINSKTTKYYLRNNDFDNALKTISLFVKNNENLSELEYLHIMQVNWLVIEEADCYFRLFKKSKNDLIKKLQNVKQDGKQFTDEELKECKEQLVKIKNYRGIALKRYKGIDVIYNTYINDQYDFHSFCMRKGTARAYLQMLNWADNLYNNGLYLRAIKGILEILFEIYHGDENTEIIGLEQKFIVNKKGGKKSKAKKLKAEEISKIKCYAKDEDYYSENYIATILKDHKNGPLTTLNEKYLAKISKKNSITYLKLSFFVNLKTNKFLLAFNDLKTMKLNYGNSLFLKYALLELIKTSKKTTDAKLMNLNTIIYKSIGTLFKDIVALTDSPEDIYKKLSSNVTTTSNMEDLYYDTKTSLNNTGKLEVLQLIEDLKSKDLVDASFGRSELLIVEDFFKNPESFESYYWV